MFKTMMKRSYHKPFVFLMLAVLLVTGILQPLTVRATSAASGDSLWPEAPEISAEAAVVMELTTGTILYQKNAHAKHYPASVTKIMTALLALENSEMDEMVEYTEDAVYGNGYNSSSIGMTIGEHLSMENSLYGMMLASANEVAKAIAIHVGGSLENFVDMMNARAKELGCTGTHFVNPNGLHDENHYTTAIDMAKIAREAWKNKKFLEIAGSKYKIIPPTEEVPDGERPVSNSHLMFNPLQTNDYLYEPAYAGKTGYTTEAGYSLVTYAKVDNLDVVCVILHGYNRESQYTSGITMLESAFENFEMVDAPVSTLLEVIPKNDVLLQHLAEEEGYDGYEDVPLSLRLDRSSIVLPKNEDPSAWQYRISFRNGMEVTPGENVIGTMQVRYAGHEIALGEILFESEREDGYEIPAHVGSREIGPDGQIEGYDVAAENTDEADDAAEKSEKSDAHTEADTGSDTGKNEEKTGKRGVSIPLLILAIVVVLAAACVIAYEVLIGIPYRKKRKVFLKKQREYEEADE